MSSTTKQVKVELPNALRVYTDGTVERLWGPPTVPATLSDPETGVSSKDITLCPTTNLTARIYLPNKSTSSPHQQKLPIVVYFHGGGFCLKSAFSSTEHRYMNHLSSHAHVIIVNVEYRLAPEHPLPAAYEDGFTAVNSLSKLDEPWLVSHGDFDKIFVGGDSAGANIAHNVVMRAGNDTGEKGETNPLHNNNEHNKSVIRIHGIFLCHSYFLGPRRVGARPPQHDMGFNKEKAFGMWELAYPGAGPHHHMINPLVKDGPSLKGLGCDKVLVVIGEKDDIVDWGVLYYNGLKESGFNGSVELFEVKGEGHSFQLLNPTSDNAKLMIQKLASFFNE